MKTCLVTSVKKVRHFSLKGGFDGSAHVQATMLIIPFLIVYETIGSLQMTLSGNSALPRCKNL